jgi:CubicO group peptidase (beta-lactamase class C family)
MTPCIVTAVADDDVVQSDEDVAVPWWSYTKTVLAAATLRLVAQGRFRLDEPVAGASFTLRQLLQHRAGLPDYGPLSEYHEAVAAGETPWPTAELLQTVRADRLLFEPGQGWSYSNVGYLLVRQLIEEAAGASLGPALNTLVLDPLGVSGVSVAKVPEDLDATFWGNASRYHPGWVYHGLLIGPAGSAALLLHRLLAGLLLPSPLLSAMCAPHSVSGPMSGRPWRSAGYGLGLMLGVGEPPGRYIGHTGAGPGSTAAVYQRATERGARRTAAAFAPVETPGAVERRAMALTFGEEETSEA